MGKAITFLTASLALSAVAPVFAQDTFKDVPKDHWAYKAVDSLQKSGVLQGYPEGLFRGKRTLSRYEFAVALDRAMTEMKKRSGEIVRPEKGAKGDKGDKGDNGAAGEKGDKGDKGDPGMTPDEIATWKKLLDTFGKDLERLGTDVRSANARLDRLSKDVDAIKDTLKKMPKISGGTFLGVRGDRNNNGNFVDYDGRVGGTVPSNGGNWFTNPQFVYQFLLGVDANVGDNLKLTARVINDNYSGYTGGFGNNLSAFGGANGGRTVGAQNTYVDNLQITVPVGAVGKDSKLNVGRLKVAFSPLTLWRPDVDTYFNNTFADDRYFRADGARFNTNFGSVGADFAVGNFTNVVGVNGGGLFTPIAGAASANLFNQNGIGAGVSAKPTGQANQGQAALTQFAALNLGLPLHFLEGGNVRLTGILTAGAGGAGFRNVGVYGADVNLKVNDSIGVKAAYSMTTTGNRISNLSNKGQNSAITADVNYKSGSFGAALGFKYIDPLFYAPGYWGRIGNWINPTNIMGGTIDLSYDLNDAIGIMFKGQYFNGARNRGTAGGYNTNDGARTGSIGIRYDVSKNVRANISYEYVQQRLGSALGGGGGLIKTREQYLNLGAGYSLNSTTVLNLGVQVGEFNGRGLLGANGLGQTTYNFSTFTSSLAVKF